MLTRKDLKQIYYINREIEMWKSKLDSITEIGAVKVTGMPGVRNTADSVSKAAIKREEIQTVINGKLAELQIKCCEVMEFIDGIDDSLMRQIMLYRFVDCLSWRQVSGAVYGRYDEEDDVRMMCNRFLKKNNIF